MSVRDRIEALLHAHAVDFRILEHAYAATSEAVAAARGTPLHWGGKSLVFKLGKRNEFAVFAISASRTINSKQIRRHLGLSRLRFATSDELFELTGLKPGCVPPFGRPIFDLPLYVDTHLSQQEELAFSIGEHTVSATMKVAAYLDAAKPFDIFEFSGDSS